MTLGVVRNRAMEATLLFAMLLFSYGFALQDEFPQKVPAMFAFGSSVVDTGNEGSLWPLHDCNLPPYHFNRGGQCSDGRLLIDIWAEVLNLPNLSAYFNKLPSSNFTRGACFAQGGSTARNLTYSNPFVLSMQLEHFTAFKTSVHVQENKQLLPSEDIFSKALYVVATGGNDLLRGYRDYLSFEQVAESVPEICEAVLTFIRGLYGQGARSILVENVYPQGCVIEEKVKDELDVCGCSKPHNEVVQLYNRKLKSSLHNLSHDLSDASIVYVDTYAARYKIISNYRDYGFEYQTARCYCKGVVVCNDSSKYTNWDGTHFTDAFNVCTMKELLSGKYFYPKFIVPQLKLHVTDSCSFQSSGELPTNVWRSYSKSTI